MSPVRRHFWQVVARVKLGSPSPMNSRLNWFIPAGVKSTVGSLGTRTSLGRRTHPLEAKKSRYASRRSSVVISGSFVVVGERGRGSSAGRSPRWGRLAPPVASRCDLFHDDRIQVGGQGDGPIAVADGLREIARIAD